jgi:alpha-amylase/alpha-mannosidase (GH57 family)
MTKLAILWHMHQPYYEDPATGEHILPWVRMHALKDYRGMVDVLAPFPRVQVTFNLVPSLLVQLEAFAAERARDPHLEIGLKPAAELSPPERARLVADGFHSNADRMIAPRPRYAALHGSRAHAAIWTDEEYRDLQVWHKLAWIDPDVLASDPRLLDMQIRGSQFSEQDKATLREIELELLRTTVPAYRAAASRGQIELSTSPFYHPILPLLCDSGVHQRAHPDAPRLDPPFERPDDARTQIMRALAFHESVFGARPIGMWPSEGSVSDAVAGLAAEAGLGWLASDEDVLSRSLGRALPRDGHGLPERADLLYRPYRGDAAPAVAIGFRDHVLSDRIGFVYQSWDPAAAAQDFIERVREGGRRFAAATGGREATVFVILDGENAWEQYVGGGRPFLRELYGRLQAADDIRTVTMAEACQSDASGGKAGTTASLPSLFPGSWIHADFYIWMGHADDRRAWAQLQAAREAFDRHSAQAPAADRDRAFEALLIAEGSDWFWWYGDDHSSAHDPEFDELFRRHVRNVYTALGLTPPAELFQTNITTPVQQGAGSMHRVT